MPWLLLLNIDFKSTLNIDRHSRAGLQFRLWRIRSFPVLVAVTRLTPAYYIVHFILVLLGWAFGSFVAGCWYWFLSSLVFPASLVVSIEIVRTVQRLRIDAWKKKKKKNERVEPPLCCSVRRINYSMYAGGLYSIEAGCCLSQHYILST